MAQPEDTAGNDDSTLPYPEICSSLPTEDRTALCSIAREDIPSWALAKILQNGEHTSTFIALHNAAVPIHRIPAEILIEIFSSDILDHLANISHLMQVCRRWTSVIRGAPRFWADAVAKIVNSSREFRKENIPGLRSWLSLSGMVPMGHLYLSFGRIWNEFTPHMRRLTSLTIDIFLPSDFSTIHRMVRSDLQNLTNLELRCDRSRLYWQQWELPDGGLSWDAAQVYRLRTLTMPGTHFSTAFATRFLETLRLTDGVSSEDTLCDALDMCHSLTSLDLPYTWWRHGPEETDTVKRKIFLANLRQLFVYGQADNVCTILASLIIPPSAIVKITILDPDYDDETSQLLNAFPPDFVGVNAPPYCNRICLGASEASDLDVQGYTGSQMRLWINQACRVYPDPPSLVLESFHAFTISELSVNLHLMRDLPRDLPRLQRLELLERTSTSDKRILTEWFLGPYRGAGLPSKCHLSLLWVVGIEGSTQGDEARIKLEVEMGILEDALRTHQDLAVELSRLELGVAASEPLDDPENSHVDSLALCWQHLRQLGSRLTGRAGRIIVGDVDSEYI